MHKFFCSYNNLTEKYELSKANSFLFNKNVSIQNENNMLDEIKANIQSLYELLVSLKEKTNDNEILNKINEIELLVSNLYYSFFASPLELPKETSKESSEKEILTKCIDLALSLEKSVNIPEYNRLCHIITEEFRSIMDHTMLEMENKTKA